MSINKDQVEGRFKEAGGKVQETAGKALGNTKQQLKGTLNKAAGAGAGHVWRRQERCAGCCRGAE